MTNYDFIHKYFNTNLNKRHRNLFYENNILYSYGYHYPLLFPITSKSGKKYWILNISGYSNTTAKHINHCRNLADLSIKTCNINLDSIIKNLQDQKMELMDKMINKRRKNTYIYKSLEFEYDQIRDNLFKLLN